MEYTKTVTVKRTYNVEFFPNAFDCTVGEFIQQRERLGIPTQGFKTCFICGRHLAMNRIPIVISVYLSAAACPICWVICIWIHLTSFARGYWE